eukprot:m.167857 g.167857  ORF g.167857 m.167857 type:complete len:136 (-) comp17203_c1_seq2:3423-3830(-)
MQRLERIAAHLSPSPSPAGMSSQPSPVTTHVLDTARGCPAAGLPLRLVRADGPISEVISSGVTNADGRCPNLIDRVRFTPGRYRMEFDTGVYFSQQQTVGFYPFVHITFDIIDPKQHYHVPLLLSPYGYSTYRGS